MKVCNLNCDIQNTTWAARLLPTALRGRKFLLRPLRLRQAGYLLPAVTCAECWGQDPKPRSLLAYQDRECSSCPNTVQFHYAFTFSLLLLCKSSSSTSVCTGRVYVCVCVCFHCILVINGDSSFTMYNLIQNQQLWTGHPSWNGWPWWLYCNMNVLDVIWLKY